MLGIYVHIPFCKSKCAYCNFVSGSDLSSQNLYIKRLLEEIYNFSVMSDDLTTVDTIYIGGGTPSMLSRGNLTLIIDALSRKFNILPQAELSIEANPDSCTPDFLRECADNKINRLSLGLQSCNDEILKKIGRPHNFNDFYRSIDNAIGQNIKNISCDLMLGLPSDTLSGVTESLKQVVDLPINHVSLYSLKVEEGTPLYLSGYCTDEDLQVDMYNNCYEFLKTKGYERYEVSNFAKNGKISRHNYKYWQLESYVGFGAAAHSFYNSKRFANPDDVSAYILGKKSSILQLNRSDKITETIMLSLRTSNGLDCLLLNKNYGYDIMNIKREEIDRLLKLGMIIICENRIKITDDAFYVMNSVIVELI